MGRSSAILIEKVFPKFDRCVENVRVHIVKKKGNFDYSICHGQKNLSIR